MEQYDTAAFIIDAGHQHFRRKGTDLLRLEIDHGKNLAPDEFVKRIQPCDLRARLLDAEFRAEIYAQTVSRFARFRKGQGIHDRPDAKFDTFEIGPRDFFHRQPFFPAARSDLFSAVDGASLI